MAPSYSTPKILEMPKKLTVDRSKWLRGLGSPKSALRKPDGRMCCLGQIALQCGAKEEEILRLQTPDQLYATRGIYIKGLSTGDRRSGLACEAMLVNDNPLIEDAERETRLTGLFREAGYELSFEGDGS